MTGGMDTDALKTFIQTYAAGSLAGAARRLKITSMAATRRLAALEAELGVQRGIAQIRVNQKYLPSDRGEMFRYGQGCGRFTL